ncbi:hypothetical protein JCM10908_003356 [Rhodotorula pacifica]|uniref:S-adenosylmethionine-dependent methyltransferase n=1 Tax=Rhodotorula pacifica TaxID=1495444 RepID=UPI00317D6808
MVRELVEQEKPLAYILGTQPFHPLPVDLLVGPPTLIPRPETEHWVNLLLERLILKHSPRHHRKSRAPFRILDIGTGSGCIALGLTYGLAARTRDRASEVVVQTVAVDQSTAALSLARENAERCGLTVESSNGGGDSSSSDQCAARGSRIAFRQADLFSPAFTSSVLSALRASSSSSPHSTSAKSSSRPDDRHSPISPPLFDLVVSNPPYIPLHEYEALEPSVREWEDRRALVGEAAATVQGSDGSSSAAFDDGLIFYRRIVNLLETLLRPPSATSASEGSGASTAGQGEDEGEDGGERERLAPIPEDNYHPPCVAFEVGQGQARAVEQMLLDWRPSWDLPSSSASSASAEDADAGRRGAWRLETELVVDPWGVERAVFASWVQKQ